MDVDDVYPACGGLRFGKIVLPGTKVIGSARGHRWTPHTTHSDPKLFFHEAQRFWKAIYWATIVVEVHFLRPFAQYDPGTAISKTPPVIRRWRRIGLRDFGEIDCREQTPPQTEPAPSEQVLLFGFWRGAWVAFWSG
jgi:hypothetical protein